MTNRGRRRHSRLSGNSVDWVKLTDLFGRNTGCSSVDELTDRYGPEFARAATSAPDDCTFLLSHPSLAKPEPSSGSLSGSGGTRPGISVVLPRTKAATNVKVLRSNAAFVVLCRNISAEDSSLPTGPPMLGHFSTLPDLPTKRECGSVPIGVKCQLRRVSSVSSSD